MSLERVDQVHARAVEVSQRYLRVEADLVDVLIEVERERVFLRREHASLFKYVTAELRLGANVAYALITVARKVSEVPALGVKLHEGALTLSNARRVASVLTLENQSEWIGKACSLSSRALEREIARVRPEMQVEERVSYVGGDRVRLQVGLTEATMLRLRDAQDLLCQSRRRAVNLEETIGVLASDFIRRADPVERAKRQVARKGTGVAPNGGVGELVTRRVENVRPRSGFGVKLETETRPQTQPLRPSEAPPARRAPIRAEVLHAVRLRDQGRCTHLLPDGVRCNQRRWVDIHHVRHLSQGGADTVDNLVTLCSAHHRLRHLGEVLTHPLHLRHHLS